MTLLLVGMQQTVAAKLDSIAAPNVFFVLIPSFGACKTSFCLNAKTGRVFSAPHQPAGALASIKLRGVVFQKQNLVAGLTDAGGLVVIQPSSTATGTTGVITTGAGTLVLNGSNTNTGTLTVIGSNVITST
ncbi:MAG: hypothetical protein QOD99_1493, partial [Chthoniobacter sp.]|nr:hypothetical protein [Chthoniobacter sp.]